MSFNPHIPENIDQIILHDSIRKKILDFFKEGVPRNYILYGPVGRGKTTLIRVILNHFLGTESTDYIELNASDENGIDTIRDIVIPFVQTIPENLPFKFMIFEESESLTFQAQAAMRRVMDIYSFNCAFIYTCNRLDKIIPAIRSRCELLDFNLVNKEGLVDHFYNMGKDSGYTLEDISNLVENLDYDYRQIYLRLVNKDFRLTRDSITNEVRKFCHLSRKGIVGLAKKIFLRIFTENDAERIFEILLREVKSIYPVEISSRLVEKIVYYFDRISNRKNLNIYLEGLISSLYV